MISKVYICRGLQKFEIKALGVCNVSWKDLVCLCSVVMGFVLFLYGANCYVALVGWVGVCLVVAGIIVKIVLVIWDILKSLKKKGDG